MSMNLLASADTLPAPGGMSAPLAFIYDLFNNPLFIFIGGLVLLGVFFWYLGSDQDKVMPERFSLSALRLFPCSPSSSRG